MSVEVERISGAGRAGGDGPGGVIPRLRQARGAGACAEIAEFFFQQLGGGLGGILSEEPAAAELIEEVTDRRGHREGDLDGIDAVLLASHGWLSMALVWHTYSIRQIRF